MNQTSRIAILTTLAALAACGDSATAPPSRSIQPVGASGGGSSATLTGSDTIRFSFVIDPSRVTSYNLGAGNSITFPVASLCDPYSSSYGPGTWDQPCNVASSPLTVSAKAWLDTLGNPRIDFSPSIRFVPTTNPAGWVVINFTDWFQSVNPFAAIAYCPTPTSTCVDESASDPTMATFRNPVTGLLTRRIKHFSGYNVAAGDGSDSDPSSIASFNKVAPATPATTQPSTAKPEGR